MKQSREGNTGLCALMKVNFFFEGFYLWHSKEQWTRAMDRAGLKPFIEEVISLGHDYPP